MKLTMDVIEDLLHSVGKLALEEGEAWRLEHVELMDAYEAACMVTHGPFSFCNQQSHKPSDRDHANEAQTQSRKLQAVKGNKL